MKPPYAIITAHCPRHGYVQVQRKRNPKAGRPMPNGSGALQTPYPGSVVCTQCTWHAKVTKVEEVTAC